jgi:hypothetical protein
MRRKNAIWQCTVCGCPDEMVNLRQGPGKLRKYCYDCKLAKIKNYSKEYYSKKRKSSKTEYYDRMLYFIKSRENFVFSKYEIMAFTGLGESQEHTIRQYLYSIRLKHKIPIQFKAKTGLYHVGKFKKVIEPTPMLQVLYKK